MTPTARSLAHYRRLGYLAEVVERWLPRVNRRKDLFGCVDIIAARPGELIGVQATSTSNVAARIAKARAIPELRVWLTVARFVVIGWDLRNGRWVPRIVELTATDLAEVTMTEIVKPPRRRRKDRFQPLDLLAGCED